MSQAVAEIKATVRAVRGRLEALFAERRQWHADDFADCYLRHPLAGSFAARLAWTFTPADGSPAVRGCPDLATGGVRTPASTVPVPPGCLVQLVHPVTLDTGDLAALRRLCESPETRQPVRQLWRQTYRLTAAERDTGLYTERYRGHILRFAQPTGWRAAAAGLADSCPARGTAATPQPRAATTPPRACGRPGPSPGSTT